MTRCSGYFHTSVLYVNRLRLTHMAFNSKLQSQVNPIAGENVIFLQGNRTELFLLYQDLSGVRVCSVLQMGFSEETQFILITWFKLGVSNRDSRLPTPSLVALQKLFKWKYCSGLLVVHNHPGYFQP